MSSLFGKLESDIEIKASPKQFHDMFRYKPHHINKAAGEKIQGCGLHEGEWGTVGSIIYWNYFHDGKPQVIKHVVEAIDEGKNLITLRVIEGDILEKFKSFKLTIQASPKPSGEQGSVVRWTMEFEKLHPGIVDPHTFVQFFADISKDIDTYLLQA